MLRYRKEKDFRSCFDPATGAYMRTGIMVDGKDSGRDPFRASFPELLDIGIMGTCKNRESGLCLRAGVECYQDGMHEAHANMSIEDFAMIVRQCRGNTYQIALGGRGDPDQHEQFEEILRCCRGNGIVPNFTTSGIGMTADIARICKRYCGAVAVSWYRSSYTDQAIRLLLEAGVKTNIHYVLSKSTIAEALQRLKHSVTCGEEVNDKELNDEKDGFPEVCNAIIFLLHKPVGLGTQDEMITNDNEEFQELLAYINDHDFPYKIGFDSCSVPALLGLQRCEDNHIDKNSIDTCEGARWSAYISSELEMMPCSFDNQKKRWAVSLRDHSIKEVWEGEVFEDFRSRFMQACPDCPDREACFGGCPIVPEIVLCAHRSGDENSCE